MRVCAANRCRLCRARHNRHKALSRLADDGVPVHELQMLAGHASITTTQRYMNARANSLAESMRQARARRAARAAAADAEQAQVG
jgi:site-specific recombinase XerD